MKPNYYEQVYDLVRSIPYGRVTNYGIIANYLELGSARMMGWALNHSHFMDDVPAHRVVNRKGELSGRIHFATPTLMEELLVSEGVQIEDNCVVDFKKLVWEF